MTHRPISALAAALAAIIGLCGASAPASLTYNPAHHVNNDPLWDLLNQSRVVADTRRGDYTVKFPTALIARADKPFRISGFVLPLEAASQSAHFMLVRRNTGCPFCPPNAPTEAVEILSKLPVKYTGEKGILQGTLKLVKSSSEGLFFRLESPEVVAKPT